MVFRLLITGFLIVSSMHTVIGADDDEADLRVEDVTPEILASTLPPKNTGNLPQDRQDDSAQNGDLKKTDLQTNADETANSTPPASTPLLQSTDPTLKQLIQTLEDDTERKDLITSLKALNQSSVLEPPQFVFVNMFMNIKTFLKAVVAEFKSFSRELVQKDTWSFKLKAPLFKSLKKTKGMHLGYIILIALVVQISMAALMRAAFPPFFVGLDKNKSIQNGIRTVVSLFAFFLVAHFLKAYFVKSPEMQVYAEEAIITLFMIQLGLILLRLSIVTGVLPVDPEYRVSLFGTFVVILLVWGGYTHIENFLSTDPKVFQISQPLTQFFWCCMTLFMLWIIHHYRHVIDGMLFRKLPFAENRWWFGLQQVIAGGLHYVIMSGVVLTFLAWFVHNQAMFGYLRDQLLITLVILCGLSLISSLMVSSAGYLLSNEEQIARVSNVTHRLIDILAFVSVGYIAYRWIVPLVKMRGISTSGVSDKLFGIFLIITLTILIIYGLNRLFNGSMETKGANKHLKTFLPIVDRLSKLVVFVIAGLLILIELNVNIMPIVASFSVLGLGIGLASKSIIEDFINGLFIIQENDFNIGDIVTIGGITGTIENITLRKLHLRDTQGFMNFIPFSNVGAITNRSRDFNAIKVDIPLPSIFHLKRTVNILEDVGQQLLQDPDLKGYIISPPKFIGVSEFLASSHPNAEVSTVMQFEIKTMPGKLILVAGEFRKLAKLAFEEMERIMSP
jgi:small-conductance mechanosensitive channel